jgi:nitroreductase
VTDAQIVDAVIRTRRSTRAYTAQPVARDVIQEILDVARWAPSGSNSQQWRVIVAGGAIAEDLRERLKEVARGSTMTEAQAEAFRAGIASGPMAWILDCVEEPIHQYLPERSMAFYDAPVALVVTFPGQPHARVPAGVPAFVTTLMLAAEAHGLGTIWLGWPLGQPQILRDTLAIPEDEQLGAFVALGYPDRDAPVNRARAPREGVETFTRWTGWD